MTDSDFRIYDCRNLVQAHKLVSFDCHKAQVTAVKFNKNGRTMISTGLDSNVQIYVIE